MIKNFSVILLSSIFMTGSSFAGSSIDLDQSFRAGILSAFKPGVPVESYIFAEVINRTDQNNGNVMQRMDARDCIGKLEGLTFGRQFWHRVRPPVQKSSLEESFFAAPTFSPSLPAKEGMTDLKSLLGSGSRVFRALNKPEPLEVQQQRSWFKKHQNFNAWHIMQERKRVQAARASCKPSLKRNRAFLDIRDYNPRPYKKKRLK